MKVRGIRAKTVVVTCHEVTTRKERKLDEVPGERMWKVGVELPMRREVMSVCK